MEEDTLCPTPTPTFSASRCAADGVTVTRGCDARGYVSQGSAENAFPEVPLMRMRNVRPGGESRRPRSLGPGEQQLLHPPICPIISGGQRAWCRLIVAEPQMSSLNVKLPPDLASDIAL